MRHETDFDGRPLAIPRRIDDPGRFMIGQKVSEDLMSLYGPDGNLLTVFDSAREVDLYVPEGDMPITADDLAAARAESFDYDEAGLTYFIGGDVGAIKIGRSVNVAVRLKDIQACSPIPVRVLATRAGNSREKMYHRLFAAHRLHGEWFERCPEIEAEIARLNSIGIEEEKR